MRGIILCARSKSSRVPNKCLIPYNGIPHIEHLVSRLVKTEIPVFIAVPHDEEQKFMFLLDKYPKKVFLSCGYDFDPLARTEAVAKQNGITTIVRVTHDKIFVDTNSVPILCDQLETHGYDYVYSKDFIPGTGFEVMSYSAVKKAADKYKNVEHISYAIKAVTNNVENLNLGHDSSSDGIRLLVDYADDVKLMDILFSSLGSSCELKDVIEFMNDNPWLKSVNGLPETTVYTCAYNAEKWISEAMLSVAMQDNFKKIEYVIVDDCSTDKTLFKIAKFAQNYKNVHFYRNIENVGLASSSNRALKLARGKYIIRLDADDYFSLTDSVSSMISHIEERQLDVVYPDLFYGIGKTEIQKGSECHHIGGALFRTSAINHIKFTEKLRGHDSLDVFLRSKDQLKIGYIEKPLFVYRQHPKSLSKTNLEQREKIKQSLIQLHGGKWQDKEEESTRPSMS